MSDYARKSSIAYQKYGNDDDYVDDIIKEITEHFCDTLHERVQNESGPGGKTAPGFMTFGIHRR